MKDDSFWMAWAVMWMVIALSGGCGAAINVEQLNAFLLAHPFFVSEFLVFLMELQKAILWFFWDLIVRYKWFCIGMVVFRIGMAYLNYRLAKRGKTHGHPG